MILVPATTAVLSLTALLLGPPGAGRAAAPPGVGRVRAASSGSLELDGWEAALDSGACARPAGRHGARAATPTTSLAASLPSPPEPAG